MRMRLGRRGSPAGWPTSPSYSGGRRPDRCVRVEVVGGGEVVDGAAGRIAVGDGKEVAVLDAVQFTTQPRDDSTACGGVVVVELGCLLRDSGVFVGYRGV